MKYALWAGLFLLGCAAGWGLRKPVVKIEERIKEVKVVQWRTNERIVTLPGATVYRDREGNTTITGPVEITSTRSGEETVARETERKSESCPPVPVRAAQVGLLINLQAQRWWGGQFTASLGPLRGTVGAWVPENMVLRETLVGAHVGLAF